MSFHLTRSASALEPEPTSLRYPYLVRSLAVALCALLILLSGWKYLSHFDEFHDVTASDEAFYLAVGVAFSESGMPRDTWAPLYSLWYYALSWFQPDLVALHHLNYRILIILLPLLFFVAAVRCRAHPLVALITASFFLFSDLNMHLWPKVNHFATVGLLLALAITARMSPVSQLGWMAFSTFLLTYSRPEMIVPSVIFLIAAFVVGRRLRADMVSYAGAVVTLITMVIVLPSFGYPSGGERSLLALQQHFALNWVKSNDTQLDSWVDYELIWQETFGDATSLPAAILENPQAIGRHWLANLVTAPKNALITLVGNPWTPSTTDDIELYVTLFAAIIFLTLALTFRWWKPCLRERLRANTALIGIVSVIVVANIAQLIVVYPRPQYFLTPVVLLTLLGTVIFFGDAPTRRRPARSAVLALAAGTVLLFITPSSFDYDGPFPGRENAHIVDFVKCVTKPGDTPLPVLDAQAGLAHYLGRPFVALFVNEKDQGFASWLVQRSIKLVIVSQSLKDTYRFETDPEWQHFLNHPMRFDFTVFPIPGTEQSLFIHREHVAFPAPSGGMLTGQACRSSIPVATP